MSLDMSIELEKIEYLKKTSPFPDESYIIHKDTKQIFKVYAQQVFFYGDFGDFEGNRFQALLYAEPIIPLFEENDSQIGERDFKNYRLLESADLAQYLVSRYEYERDKATKLFKEIKGEIKSNVIPLFGRK
jgi:hypothetical protein